MYILKNVQRKEEFAILLRQLWQHGKNMVVKD